MTIRRRLQGKFPLIFILCMLAFGYGVGFVLSKKTFEGYNHGIVNTFRGLLPS